MPKTDDGKAYEQLIAENVELCARLEEAEETLRAIRSGEVDALMVAGPNGDQVFTLSGADRVYRALIENMSEGALTLTAGGVILYANRRFADMVQTPLERVVGAAIAAWLAPESRAALETLLHNRDERCSAEVLLATGSGAQLAANLSVNRLFMADLPDVYCMVVTDLTEQKQSTAALAASEEKFRYIFDHSVIGKSFTLPSGEITVNKAFCDMLGYTSAELADHKWQELTHPDDIALSERMLAPLRAGKQNSTRFTKRYLHKDGSTIWADVGIALRRDAEGKPIYFVTSVNDITVRKQAEAELVASQSLYRLLAENSSDAISLIDAAGTVVYISPAYARHLGFDEGELLNLDTPGILHLIHPDDRAAIAAEIKRGRDLKLPTSRYEYRLRAKGGDYVWLEDVLRRDFDEQGQFVRTIVNSRDVTARKQAEAERDRLQAQLAEAQKMELVGRLAGGIAHEFNNMLAGIMLRTELLLHAGQPDTPLQRSLTTIYGVAQRAAEMVRSLLGFARKQMIAPRMLDLNAAVESSLPMLHNLVGEEITVVWQPGSHIWPVKIDPTQFEQILINLCTNARDAIAGVGAITIETAELEMTHAVDVSGHDVPPGAYVLLAVTDTGCGMDQALFAHIFEPFFTTKEVGKGSGLGLAAVAGIVQQNGGYIQILTEPGAGTTFKIFLPGYTETVAPGEQGQTPSLPYGHGETVMLVEDEAMVLQMTADALQYLGYNVIAAAAPAEAIRQMEGESGTVDLLMTDVVMPAMNGAELAARIAALRPGIRHLFVSGYPADIVAQRGALGDDVHFLQKPFTLQELATKVSALLAKAAPINSS